MNYTLFDAFVILHGTDTMAYTSSALSFLLEDLGKTVVWFHRSRFAASSDPKVLRRSSLGHKYLFHSSEMTPWIIFWVLCASLVTTSSQVPFRQSSRDSMIEHGLIQSVVYSSIIPSIEATEFLSPRLMI